MQNIKKYFFLLMLGVMSLALHAQNNDYVNYIEAHKDIAIEQMHRYHIPASITLVSNATHGMVSVPITMMMQQESVSVCIKMWPIHTRIIRYSSRRVADMLSSFNSTRRIMQAGHEV